MNTTKVLKRYIGGEEKKLQRVGNDSLGIIIPKTLLRAFDLSFEKREIIFKVLSDGILISPNKEKNK